MKLLVLLMLLGVSTILVSCQDADTSSTDSSDAAASADNTDDATEDTESETEANPDSDSTDVKENNESGDVAEENGEDADEDSEEIQKEEEKEDNETDKEEEDKKESKEDDKGEKKGKSTPETSLNPPGQAGSTSSLSCLISILSDTKATRVPSLEEWMAPEQQDSLTHHPKMPVYLGTPPSLFPQEPTNAHQVTWKQFFWEK